MAFVDGAASIELSFGFRGRGRSLLAGGAEIALGIDVSGSLSNSAVIGRARPLSPFRIRVDFSREMVSNSALSNPASYVLATADSGAVLPSVNSVSIPLATHPRFVDLIVSEMTEGAEYSLDIDVGAGLVSPDGSPAASSPYVFDGVGHAPAILVAIATAPNAAEIQFTERVRKSGDLLNVSAYTFDEGLSVLSVQDGGSDRVLLTTSVQEPGVLYTLTLNGSVLDLANNPLVAPASSPMLGYTAPTEAEALLRLDAYKFLIKSLRDDDEARGHAFIRRLFDGFQAVWSAITNTIFDIPKINSIEDAPDGVLEYQKNIVGWTKKLDHITSSLDEETLRRLIGSSAEFWKTRGPESSTEDILRLVTGARVHVRNWFHYRSVLDESQWGEDWEGSDFWLLGAPGEGETDAWTYDVRIVDDGGLDRSLVRDLVRLTRPGNERVQIQYLWLLDRFLVDGDDVLWNGDQIVANGSMLLAEGESTVTSDPVSVEWTNYLASWKAKTDGMAQLDFYVSGPGDKYSVRWAPRAVAFSALPGGSPQWGGPSQRGIVQLLRFVEGTPTQMALVQSASTALGTLEPDVFYTFRVEATPIWPGSPTNRIRLYVDGVLVATVEDSNQARGGIGATSELGELTLGRVEVSPLPAESDFLDINS